MDKKKFKHITIWAIVAAFFLYGAGLIAGAFWFILVYMAVGWYNKRRQLKKELKKFGGYK